MYNTFFCGGGLKTTFLQNKCVRYWPDLNSTKEFGKVCVKNIEEHTAQDYIRRELEVTRLDRVRSLS